MVRSMMMKEYPIHSCNITLGSSFSSIFELGGEASSSFLFLSHNGGFELWIFSQIEEGTKRVCRQFIVSSCFKDGDAL